MHITNIQIYKSLKSENTKKNWVFLVPLLGFLLLVESAAQEGASSPLSPCPFSLSFLPPLRFFLLLSSQPISFPFFFSPLLVFAFAYLLVLAHFVSTAHGGFTKIKPIDLWVCRWSPPHQLVIQLPLPGLCTRPPPLSSILSASNTTFCIVFQQTRDQLFFRL